MPNAMKLLSQALLLIATFSTLRPSALVAAQSRNEYANGGREIKRNRNIIPDFKLQSCRPRNNGNGSAGRGRKCETPPVRNLAGLFDKSFIDVELEDGRKVKFDKRSTNNQQEATNGTRTWFGKSGENTFNLVQKGSIMAGSFLVDGVVYQIMGDQTGTIEITEMRQQDFPPDEKEPPEWNVRRSLRKSVEKQIKSHQSPSYNEQGHPIMDVMIIYTANAECANSWQYSGCSLTNTTKAQMDALCLLAVEETNAAYTSSGINAEMRLVYSGRTDYTETDFSSDLYRLREQSDGYMDDVHELRQEYGADIVALLVDNDWYCGLGYFPGESGPSSTYWMYSVTHYGCATGYFTFGHETAHNMGCHHDRETAGSYEKYPYQHGYRDITNGFRTIMAYPCPNTYCPKVQMFSNTVATTGNGLPVGNAYHDCARQINKVAETVSGFLPAKEVETTPTPAPSATVCDDPALTLDFTLYTDSFPSENSWEIIDKATGQIVGSKGAGVYTSPQTLYTETFCAEPGVTYTFVFKDSWGDGLFGDSYYNLVFGGTALATTSTFGSVEETDFGG